MIEIGSAMQYEPQIQPIPASKNCTPTHASPTVSHVEITPRIIGGVKAVENLCQPHDAAPLSIDDCRYHTLDRDLIAYGRLSRG